MRFFRVPPAGGVLVCSVIDDVLKALKGKPAAETKKTK